MIHHTSRALITCLLAGACLALPAAGQEKPKTDPKAGAPGTPGAPAAPAPFPAVIDRNHHLGPGDVVDIVVENYPDLSKSVRLFSDGTFDYPILGSVQSAGLTIKELESRLADGLRKELRRPRVYANLREVYIPPVEPMKIPKIVALGAVSRKGEMEMPEPRPLRIVLALLGPDANADLSSIRVRYPDGSARVADFRKFATDGPEAVKDSDFDIKGGEEIILLERIPDPKPEAYRFSVLGAVAKPGSFVTEQPLSIVEIIDKAGGAKPGAELEKIEISGPAHKDKVLVNLEKYINGDTAANYMLNQDDVVIVQLKPLRVLMVGETTVKGWINIRPDETLMQIFLTTGIPGGDYSKTQIIRRGKDGKPEYTTVNVRDIMKQKKQDVKLMPEDVIFVPHKTQKRNIFTLLQQFTAPLWMLRGGLLVP
jgi:protein involved in polysaccharide export with SLBB domain